MSRIRFGVRAIGLVASLALVATGCRSSQPPFPNATLRPHVLSINENGASYYSYPYSGEAKGQGIAKQSSLEHALAEGMKSECVGETQGEQLERSVQEIIQGLRAHAERMRQEKRPVRIMLFLHGGLVSMKAAMQEAEELRASLSGEEFYPIFVNWETGMLKSYLNDLARVRQGVGVTELRGYSTAPAHLFADMFRAVGRSPVFLFGQARDLLFSDAAQPVPVNEHWRASAHLDDRPDPTKTVSYEALLQVVPGFLRLLTTSALDFLGQGAFDNMQRRARVLFLLDDDFSSPQRQECGALSRLMNEIRFFEQQWMDRPDRNRNRDDPSRNRGDDALTRLRAVQTRYRALPSAIFDSPACTQCERSNDARARSARKANWDELAIYLERQALITQVNSDEEKHFRIDLVAHSMGAILANEILHRNSDLYFENVVYMAGAASIKDFAALALPYLRANPTSNFYILTLHPETETNEATLAYVVPKGSLLEWIDSYITQSKSELDYTMGRWNNLMRALPLMDYLESEDRARLSIVGFGRKPGRPRKHGDFNNAPGSDGDYIGAEFWSKEFWQGESFD